MFLKGVLKRQTEAELTVLQELATKLLLKFFRKLEKHSNIPTVTDIHEVADAQKAAAYVDVLQIPAFLSSTNRLSCCCCKNRKGCKPKKGQFMSPESMQFAVQKVKDSGNDAAWITDRGTQFGYTDLIVDFRGVPAMRSVAPTVLDVTHSLQQPNQASGVTGGRPELIETIARAGIVNHMDGLFIETHPNPSKAKSDGANMLSLGLLEGMLSRLNRDSKNNQSVLNKSVYFCTLVFTRNFFEIMGSTGFDSEINRTVSMSSNESQLVKLSIQPLIGEITTL